MLEIRRASVSFDEKDLMELEIIITDSDEKEALNFLKKCVYRRILHSQEDKLKSHLDAADPVAGFVQRSKTMNSLRRDFVREDKIRHAVREQYSRIAEQGGQQPCCQPGGACCGTSPAAEAIIAGYTKEQLAQIPQDAVLGLGCGNPAACAELKPGQTVLDLGSGAGIDVFLAATKVGPEGKAIGVDITPEMVKKANSLSREKDYQNVEFRLGEIETLPVADNAVDTIMSNCVINLSTDKARVFRESYRVLKPGSKMVISDIVSERVLPDRMRDDLGAWSQCISGALEMKDYLDKISAAGFGRPKVISRHEFYVEGEGDETHRLLSITVRAEKPL